ncbi:MAG: ABC transporter permease [Gemmatimonadetes bacterium]|nr:ABC transporter permease [Gemmatimonadota bacterium]
MTLIQNLHFAARSLSRSPGFTLAFVLTLGLGIGANTAIFSVVRGVLLRPLPHRDGDNLVYLRQSAELAGVDNTLFSVPEILDYRTASTTLSGFAEFSAMTFNMLGQGDPAQVLAGIVTGDFFEVMGLGPVVGRVFDSGDDGEAAAPVLVLTNEYWMRAFGGDPAIVGKTVRMNGRTLTIVGVLQRAPHYPEQTDVFVNMVTSPHHLSATMAHGRTHRMTEVFARLTPGHDVPAARVELDAIAANVHAEYPESYEAAAGYKISVTPLRTVLTQRAALTLYVLLGTAAFVLLIACANVANLTLTRNIRRWRELVVRAALGAGTGRLRRLLLYENLVLSLAGGAVGLILAYAGVDFLVAFAERFTPRAAEIRLDWAVLAFTLVLAIGAAVAFAFVPSLPEQATMGAAIASGSTRSTGGLAKARVQRGLVVAQLAVSFVLLTGAGLFVRTLINLYGVDPGVDLENVLTMEVPATEAGRTDAEVLEYYETMRDRIAAVPGVEEVGIGSAIPLRASGFRLEVKAEGRPVDPNEPTPMAEFRTATPEYFRAAGIPLVRGREFRNTDRESSGKVVMLNETLARRLFPDQDPIGRRVAWMGDVLRFIPITGEWRTVVGVVGDTKDAGLDEAPASVMFHPFAQEIWSGSLVIRTATSAAPIARAATRIIRELDAEQPIENVLTLAEIRGQTVAPNRLNAALVAAFGVLALVIAAVGIAGVLGFSVSQRTNEIGIRMSLGADGGTVQRMVLREGALLLGIGLAIGALGSLGVSRLVTGLLFDVAPSDPLTLGAVALLLAAVSIGASWVPAARASSVEPVEALRFD